MLLVFHITIAVISILFSAFAFFKPSNKKIKATILLISGTLLSGVLLVSTSPSSFVHACISGVVYFGIVAVLIVTAQKRLTSYASG